MKLLGINDDVTTCECCGKANLKCTVVLGTDAGEVHYGRDCAARALAPRLPNGRVYGLKSAAQIEKKARQVAAGVRPVAPRPYYNAAGNRF